MAEVLERKSTVRTRGQTRQPEIRTRCGGSASVKLLALASVAIVAGSVHAQVFIVQPSIHSRLTYSDNARATENGEGDWIAEVTPAIAIARDQGRITGNLDARLRSVVYANDSDRNTSFVAMQGRGQIEAVEDALFVDMAASVSRNNRSELRGRGSEDFLSTDSDNETRIFSLGPRLHFRLGAGPEGVASYRMNWFDSGAGILSRTVENTRGELSDPQAFGRVGWALDYSRADTRYDDATDSELSEEVARATIFVNVSPQFRLRAIAGHESNEYSVRSGESSSITGAGFDWNPTPRTSLSATGEDRIFGRSYYLDFNHRRPLSWWNVSYSRDITSSAETDGSVFDDPAFASLFDALATEVPDPFEREALVRQQLGYPGIGLFDTFVTNNYFLARTLRGSVSLVGARNVLTLSVQRSERTRLGEPLVSDPRDDLSLFNDVETRSGTVSLSHRLSPAATLNTSLVRSYSEGSGTSDAETRRTTFSLGVSSRFGRRTTGSLIYRHQRAAGTSDFTENILTASVGMQF